MTDEDSYDSIKERDKQAVKFTRTGGPSYGKSVLLRAEADRHLLLEKLEVIEKIIGEHYGTRGMDNKYPDSWAEEINAVFDGTRCSECGGYPGAMYDGSLHFGGCAKRISK